MRCSTTSANAWINGRLLSSEMPSRLSHTPGDLCVLAASIRSFGFGQISDALTPFQLHALQDEAADLLSSARCAQQAAAPQYRASIVPLGPEATAFLDSPETRSVLHAVFGRNFRLSPQRSTLTYYNEGDHLGPHLDKPEEECSVTVLVYLLVQRAATMEPNTGLTLHVYGQSMPEDGCPTISFPTRRGSIVIGRGSKFWHERPRLAPGEHVAGLTGCYAEGPAS
jgi:hypothetical protein